MFHTKVVEKIRTHILCPITCFRKSCRLWDNVEKYGRVGQATDDNIILRMRFACWITKATVIHSEYVILNASMLSLYVHCLSCLVFIIRSDKIAVGCTPSRSTQTLAGRSLLCECCTISRYTCTRKCHFIYAHKEEHRLPCTEVPNARQHYVAVCQTPFAPRSNNKRNSLTTLSKVWFFLYTCLFHAF
jgi:hypothetical protein